MDSVTPFIFERRNVRGAWVEIGSGVAEMLGHHHYSEDVRRLVGESCAAVSLLAAQTTFNGRLSLQYQNGKGAVKLLVAQADAALQVRGMAKANADAHGALTELLSGGLLGLLIEGGKGQNYQALVEVRGANLAAALEGYFFQSEQLPTRVVLDGSAERLRGVLIQRLPARPDRADTDEDDAHWRHLETLFATVSPAELASTPVEELLLKVFAEEEIRTFREKPVQLACRCSHASISAMLVSLGRKELEDLLAERGVVEVTCEFCGKTYRYTPTDMHDLFAAIEAKARGSTKH